MTLILTPEVKAEIRRRQAASSASQGNNTQATELKRGLEGPRVALGTKGRASGPGMVRYDAGVYLGYDLEHSLSRETCEQDVVNVSLTVPAGGANTTTFSIDEDHYLQGITMWADSADVGDTHVFMQPFGDPNWTPLVVWDNALTDASLAGTPLTSVSRLLANPYTPFTLPLFVRQETDYRLRSSDTGAAGLEVQVILFLTKAPEGVRIPS